MSSGVRPSAAGPAGRKPCSRRGVAEDRVRGRPASLHRPPALLCHLSVPWLLRLGLRASTTARQGPPPLKPTKSWPACAPHRAVSPCHLEPSLKLPAPRLQEPISPPVCPLPGHPQRALHTPVGCTLLRTPRGLRGPSGPFLQANAGRVSRRGYGGRGAGVTCSVALGDSSRGMPGLGFCRLLLHTNSQALSVPGALNQHLQET